MQTKTPTNRINPPVSDAHKDRLSLLASTPAATRPDRLLAAADVAELLGVRERFVYALARRGELPTVRLGDRYVRFRPEALWAWLEQRESTRPRGTR
jgi:excisionase family DNA binding protein